MIPDNAPAPNPQAPERHPALPPKFTSVEALARSYTELERKLGSRTNEAVPRPTNTTPVEGTAQGFPDAPAADTSTGEADQPELMVQEAQASQQEDAAASVVQSAGLDLNKLRDEFSVNGALSPESMEALGKVGITPDVVDSYIAGQRALADRFTSELHQIAGGSDQFEEMFQWSQTAEALSHNDREAVNHAIDSKNPGAIKLAFKAVHAAWVAAEGNPPAVELRGGSGGGSQVDVYEDREEMMSDFRSQKYQTSESFRKAVAAKVARSSVL